MILRGRPLPARLAHAALGAVVVAATCSLARADGGLVRASADHDGLSVTLFTEPTPLRAGAADVSVLVQDRASRTPLLDAEVTVHLARAGATDAVASIRLGHEAADNKLLQAGRLVLPEPGRWVLRADVRRAGAHATVAAEVDVAPDAGPWRALWPALALPPVAIALFALHQALRRRRGA